MYKKYDNLESLIHHESSYNSSASNVFSHNSLIPPEKQDNNLMAFSK